MATSRPVDISIKRFYMAMGAVIVGFLVPVYLLVYLEAGEGPNVAFTLSSLILVAMVVGGLEYARRHPAGSRDTWGVNMLFATFVFMAMFWAYGVVPHQWLVWADNELNWRADRLIVGPSYGFTDGKGILDWLLPIEITYVVVRDLVVVTMYGLLLAANIVVWHIWQARGREATEEVETSEYGRPLVKAARG